MNDRDKLIEIIYCAGRDYDDCVDAQHEIGMSAYEDFDSWLADDLLANGVIVPPCKVGDTVYMIFENEIRELRVISLSYLFSSSFNHFNLHTENSRGAVLSYEMKDIGKTVFLTKEEAEKALAERSKK